MRSRAERRHHQARIKNKVSKFWFMNPRNWFDFEEARQKHLKRLASTRKPCSCHMCGNPRHFDKDKLTMQEKRALVSTWNDYEDET